MDRIENEKRRILRQHATEMGLRPAPLSPKSRMNLGPGSPRTVDGINRSIVGVIEKIQENERELQEQIYLLTGSRKRDQEIMVMMQNRIDKFENTLMMMENTRSMPGSPIKYLPNQSHSRDMSRDSRASSLDPNKYERELQQLNSSIAELRTKFELYGVETEEKVAGANRRIGQLTLAKEVDSNRLKQVSEHVEGDMRTTFLKAEHLEVQVREMQSKLDIIEKLLQKSESMKNHADRKSWDRVERISQALIENETRFTRQIDELNSKVFDLARHPRDSEIHKDVPRDAIKDMVTQATDHGLTEAIAAMSQERRDRVDNQEALRRDLGTKWEDLDSKIRKLEVGTQNAIAKILTDMKHGLEAQQSEIKLQAGEMSRMDLRVQSNNTKMFESIKMSEAQSRSISQNAIGELEKMVKAEIRVRMSEVATLKQSLENNTKSLKAESTQERAGSRAQIQLLETKMQQHEQTIQAELQRLSQNMTNNMDVHKTSFQERIREMDQKNENQITRVSNLESELEISKLQNSRERDALRHSIEMLVNQRLDEVMKSWAAANEEQQAKTDYKLKEFEEAIADQAEKQHELIASLTAEVQESLEQMDARVAEQAAESANAIKKTIEDMTVAMATLQTQFDEGRMEDKERVDQSLAAMKLEMTQEITSLREAFSRHEVDEEAHVSIREQCNQIADETSDALQQIDDRISTNLEQQEAERTRVDEALQGIVEEMENNQELLVNKQNEFTEAVEAQLQELSQNMQAVASELESQFAEKLDASMKQVSEQSNEGISTLETALVASIASETAAREASLVEQKQLLTEYIDEQRSAAVQLVDTRVASLDASLRQHVQASISSFGEYLKEQHVKSIDELKQMLADGETKLKAALEEQGNAMIELDTNLQSRIEQGEEWMSRSAEASTAKIDALEQKLGELDANHQTNSSNVTQMNADLKESMESKVTDLEKVHEDQLSKLHSTLSEMTQKLEILETALSEKMTSEETNAKLADVEKAHGENATQTKESIESLTKKLEAMESDLSEKINSQLSSMKTAEAHEEDINKTNATIEALTKKVETMETSLTEKIDSELANSKSGASQEDEIAKANASIETLTKQIEALESTLTEQTAANSKKSEAFDGEISRTNESLGDLTNKMKLLESSLEEKMEASSKRTETYDEEMGKANASIQDLTKKIDTLESSLSEKITATTQKTDDYDKELAAAKNSMEKLSKKMDSLEAAIPKQPREDTRDWARVELE